jgi:hypothetical protein
MKCHCKSTINELGNIANVESYVLAEVDVERVTNGLMETFTNGVGLRILNACWDIFNAKALKDSLEVNAHEFGSTIVDAAKWTRVLSEPQVFEL